MQSRQGFEQVPTLFARAGDDAADMTKPSPIVVIVRATTRSFSHFHCSHLLFALVVAGGIPSRIEDEGQVGSEAVVGEEVFEIRQDLHALHRFTTTLGIKMVGGELIGAEDMEPISFAVAGAPCFIGMGDGAFNEGLLDGAEGLFSFLAASGDNVGECPFAEGSTEEVAKKFAQTAVRKELVVTQVEGGGLQARAVLSGSAHRFRKGGGVGFAAVGAAATSCPVLGDFQGDRRKVKDLSCFKVIVMSGSTERLAALRTKL